MSPRLNVAASANALSMLLVACCTLSVACVGLQYDESAGAGGGQAGASTSGGNNGGGSEAAGGEGGANAFEVPSGWTGPVQVGEACNADPNSLEVVTSFSGESTCSCACTVGDCQPYVAKYSDGCETILETVPATAMDQCVDVADVMWITVEFQSASCAAQASPTPISSESVRVCSAPQGDCIYASEESAPCPEGFPNRGPSGVLTLEDARTCGACSCAVQQCELMANVANPNCTQLGFAIQEGGCLGGYDAVQVAWQPATCTTNGPIPASGSVTGVDPISVCCR